MRLQGRARDALRGLLDDVRDDGWFFDTELLVLAQRRGLRIHEVPVDWVDDPDSRVDIVRTALDDLRGVARLAAAGPVARFIGVGVLSTLAYALLFLLLRGALGAAGANAVALALTAVGQHRRQPAPHVRRARARGARPPPRARRGRLRPHPRADQRRAREPARARPRAVARRRARRAGGRQRRGDRHALCGAADLGVRPGAAAGTAAAEASC